VSPHPTVAVGIILYDEYLLHVPDGDPIFTMNVVYIQFITTNIGMLAFHCHVSHILQNYVITCVVSFIKIE
jgi:hypothetical protein